MEMGLLANSHNKLVYPGPPWCHVAVLYETCRHLVQDLYGNCMGLVYDLCKTCTRLVQALYKTCMRLVWDLHDTCTILLHKRLVRDFLETSKILW